jgi:gliding motility-associated-like protein
MNKILLATLFFVASFTAICQPILITGADLDTLNQFDCAANTTAAPNFFDSGNAGTNYGNNENEEITVCPDFGNGSNTLGVTFGINGAFTFGVHASDTIFVYDGPNTTFPLLGAHNSDTDPNGFNHIASFGINPTGCLTFVFKSDAVNDSTGWEANISCLNLPQPFTAHMIGQLSGTGPDAINPTDTGYIDICLGDSILFTATGNYPFDSTTTGHGYVQDSTTVTYEWNFSDGSTSNNKSTWFTAPARNGYLVELRITDSFGQIQTVVSKVRVATIPNFSSLFINPDTVCIGDSATIIGGVTSNDTIGVDPTSTSFQLGGSVAGQVYLPDGTGINHSDSINISGFPFGQLVAAASDIERFFLNIEHSYLGDLELMLTCPSGIEVNIFNSYGTGAGELFPGGFNGGNTYLGNAFAGNIGNPGVGMEYSWSTANATLGTMATEFGNGNFIPVTTPSAGNAMNPNGVYLPEASFASFIGCPLNGDWKITVRDNLQIDDGYIFEWGIFFDPLINPNNEVYFTEIVSHQWLPEPTIVSLNLTDTVIVVSSNIGGDYNYIFEVTDNFGCVHDTTAQVHFIPTPLVPADTSVCDTLYQITGVSTFAGGSWTFNGPGTIDFSPNNLVDNPILDADTYGIYTMIFIDNHCGLDSSFQIEFIAPASIQGDTVECSDQYQIINTTADSGGVWTFTGPGVATFSGVDTINPLITINQPGAYNFFFTDNRCSVTKSFLIDFIATPPVPADFTTCGTQYQVLGTSSYNGGIWSFTDIGTGSGTATFTAGDNPLISVDQQSIYEFTFTENQCGKDSSFQVSFVPEPTIQGDTIVCANDYQIVGTTAYAGGTWTATGPGVITFTPNNTDNNPLVSVSAQGQYTFSYIDTQCNISNSFQADFVPAPTVPADDTICVLQYQVLGSSSFNGGAWSATGPGTTTFTPDNTNQNPNISVSNYGLYNLTFTDNQCDVDTTFEIYFPAHVSVSLSNADVCLGEEVILDATSSVSEASYLWSNGSTSPSITVIDSNTYQVIVTGLCNSDTTTANVTTKICVINAPNVFTPNGDGENDFLFFDGLEHFPGSSLVVFNRWGNSVYENNDYQNDWSPSNISVGTYYYILTPNGTVDIDVINSAITILK